MNNKEYPIRVEFDGSAFFNVEGFGYRGRIPIANTQEGVQVELGNIKSAEALADFTVKHGGDEYKRPVIISESVVFEPLSVELRKQIEAANKQGGDIGRYQLGEWLIENAENILSSLEGYEDN